MDRLQAVGDPALRQALLFVRSADGSITADDLAAALGIHRNVARSRLERLVEASLLEARFERRNGRSGPGAGRPARTYSAAPAVSLLEFPPHRYDALIEILIGSLPARGRSGQLRRAGVLFGEELARTAPLRRARTLPGAVRRVCAALGKLGFHATVAGASESEAWIDTATCPLRPLVLTNPDAAAVDSGMWVGLIRSALEGSGNVEIRCEGRGCLDERTACRVRVRVG
jgi:predicted ArsR family transcriptional regulator